MGDRLLAEPAARAPQPHLRRRPEPLPQRDVRRLRRDQRLRPAPPHRRRLHRTPARRLPHNQRLRAHHRQPDLRLQALNPCRRLDSRLSGGNRKKWEVHFDLTTSPSFGCATTAPRSGSLSHGVCRSLAGQPFGYHRYMGLVEQCRRELLSRGYGAWTGREVDLALFTHGRRKGFPRPRPWRLAVAALWRLAGSERSPQTTL